MFIASIVGSSWNAAESSGLAPIRSPAETTSEFGLAARSVRMWLARKDAPPAGTLVPPGAGRMSPPLPVGGSRLPWKSLMASSWTSTSWGLATALGTASASAANASPRMCAPRRAGEKSMRLYPLIEVDEAPLGALPQRESTPLAIRRVMLR